MLQVFSHQKSPDEPMSIIDIRFHQLLNEKDIDERFSIYKVGLTGNPIRRKYGHRLLGWVTDPKFLRAVGWNPADHSQPQAWKEMHVIFESENLNKVRSLEDRLIQKYIKLSGCKSLTCWNVIGGGGGPPGLAGVYYVYLLFG
jgi:hypothetical protein